MIRSERYEDHQLHMAGGQYGKYVNEQGQLMNQSHHKEQKYSI